MLLALESQHCLEERLDLKAVACFPVVLSSLSDCLHINRALFPMGSVVCPALQHLTAAAGFPVAH